MLFRSPCPSPGDLPNPGIEPVSPVSPALQADSLPTESSLWFSIIVSWFCQLFLRIQHTPRLVFNLCVNAVDLPDLFFLRHLLILWLCVSLRAFRLLSETTVWKVGWVAKRRGILLSRCHLAREPGWGNRAFIGRVVSRPRHDPTIHNFRE